MSTKLTDTAEEQFYYIVMEQPTIKETFKQVLVATGVSLALTAGIYGTAYGVITVKGKLHDRKQKKLAAAISNSHRPTLVQP